MKILFLAIVTLIIFQFSLIVPIYADIAVVGVIGQEGTSDGDFKNPYGIAIDSSNKIFVSDFGFDNIQAFDSSGNFLFKWGENGPLESQFERLYGMDSDKFDNIYVADTYNHRVQVFDNSGNFLFQFGELGKEDGQFNAPYSLAVDDVEQIYVADGNNNRIQVFDSSGNFLFKFGEIGPENGQFQSPYDVAVHDSRIYVADLFNHRIQIFDIDGNFLSAFGSQGSENGQFQAPGEIAFDSIGNIYVTDRNNHRIQIFDNSGNFLEKLGTNGPAPGQFNLPTGIESDSEDRIYVVDRSNDRIQILLYSTDKPISLELTKDDTNLINLIGELENTLRIDSALIEIKTLTGDTILQDSILINSDGKFNFDFELPQNLVDDAYNAIITIEVDGTTITKTKTIFLYDEIPEGETCPVGQKPFFIEETSLWDCRDENTELVVEADDKNFFSSIIEIIKSILRSIRGSV